ncbi:tripartite tricarboxylate transporter permease [Glycomyces albus]
MDNLNSLLEGFGTVLTPGALLIALIGVTIGTAVGVLPGIGAAAALALLLPITYGMDPTQTFIMFAGIFYGSMFGGATASILLNTPGQASAAVTVLEGNKMAKRGRAGQALAASAVSSFVGGTIATLALVFVTPITVEFAISLGAPDFFAIMMFALVATASVLGSSRLRGFASLLLGLTIGLVGIDAVTGQQRLTFGVPQLADGLDIVVVTVGVFAVGEALWIAGRSKFGADEITPVGQVWLTRGDWRRIWPSWVRGTAIGFPLGTLPMGGSEITTFLSYVTERRFSKHRKEFGNGAIEGVAGPEATNNASAAGALVPMLALGLPVNATAAVMLAAFQTYGIQPGPLLFENEPDLVWTLIASLFIGMVFLLVLNLPLIPIWVRLLRIPKPYLFAGVLFFASMGAYAVNAQPFDLFVLLAFGLVGLAMRRFGIPVLPMIVGVLLGPIAERQARMSLQLSGGDLSGLVGGPVSWVIYALIVVVLLWPLATLARRRLARNRSREEVDA